MLNDHKMALLIANKKIKKGVEEEHKLLSSGDSISTVAASQQTVNSIAPPKAKSYNPERRRQSRIDMEIIKTSIVDGEKNEIIYKPTTIPINDDMPYTTSPEPNERPLKFANIWKQLLAALGVSFSSMAGGFISAYSSPALASMRREGSTLIPTNEEASWIGSLMPLSALVGGLLGGIIIEKLGRKMSIIIVGLPLIVSWCLIAFATNVWMVFVGRAIAGFCVGLTSLCHPVYLGETIQPEVRGTLGLLPSTFGNFGVLLSFFLGYYLEWRHLAMVGAVLPIPYLILMCLVPETPRMLLMKGNEKGARKALRWFRGANVDIEPEFEAIKNCNLSSIPETTSTSLESTPKHSPQNTIASSPRSSKNSIVSSTASKWWKSELFKWEYVKPLSISLGLMFFQQLSGINAVIFYTVDIFRDAGSTINENICTIIVGAVNFGSTFLATVLIDRMGRKVLLYLSACTMVLSLVTLSGFFYAQSVYGHEEVLIYGWLPLVAFIVFVVGFSLGFGPVPWLMMGEILPGKIRGQGASLVTAFNWAGTFVVTKTFHDLLESLGSYGTFALFACVVLVAIVFVALAVPETRGQSLEDIEKQFTRARANSIVNFKSTPNSIM